MLLSKLFVGAATLEGGPRATKESIIVELLQRLAADGHLAAANVPSVYEAVMRRERIASTGIGSGVAIPHARCVAASGPLGILAVCRSPVHFGSVDGEPADIFALLLAPPSRPGDPTPRPSDVLMRRLGDAAFRAKLRAAKSEGDIFELLLTADRWQ